MKDRFLSSQKARFTLKSRARAYILAYCRANKRRIQEASGETWLGEQRDCG